MLKHFYLEQTPVPLYLLSKKLERMDLLFPGRGADEILMGYDFIFLKTESEKILGRDISSAKISIT